MRNDYGTHKRAHINDYALLNDSRNCQANCFPPFPFSKHDYLIIIYPPIDEDNS